MTRFQVEPGRHRPGLFPVIRKWWGEKPLAQLGLFLGAGLVFATLGSNMASNMRLLGLTPGFGFLEHAANFEIGESLIPYSAGDSYGRAITAGLLNTISVSFLGCALATFLGVALGVARLSSNPLLSGSVRGYVEVIRNTPLLLQLFFWNTILRALPAPRLAFQPFPGIYLSNRGLYFPGGSAGPAGDMIFLAILAALFLALAYLLARRRWKAPMSSLHVALVVAVAICLPLAVGATLGATIVIDTPELKGFNIVGGHSISPEFAALLIALSLNAAASIAETVRAGILSVPSGQWEAGRSLGLSSLHIMRLIVLPQALRVIIPVMTSSYLSLTKNSSLAVAIGFPDLVNVLNTTANVTGQALEAICIMMLVYLSLSLAVSMAMNGYNSRWALRGIR
ncbi:ABC transporter permease subunit [Terrarubrum flagellatum]|uniref:amino acid ABC transporter permease n=1 Tax=Terrirubrum flagellatum TaxID=2895980 RepID=UPI003145523B